MDIRGLVAGKHRRLQWTVVVAATIAALAATTAAAAPGSAPGLTPRSVSNRAVALTQVVPAPVSVHVDQNVVFVLRPDSAVYATSGSVEAADAATFLAGLLRPPTGYPLPVRSLAAGSTKAGIQVVLGGADRSTGTEGYQLQVTASAVTIRANQRAGLFNGVQTLRQLLPAEVDSLTPVSTAWTVQGGQILDYPRYGYRGALLDVARHFFPVPMVLRYIDEVARYKVNYLHLHLTDDQGWRIAIDGWAQLTTIGGSTGVGGMMGGYYTQDDYRAIVAYARQRGVTVVPEIEGPAHQHAALASYAKLNCSGVAPELYTGFVESPDGFLCINKAVTYALLDDVIRQLAALTPGPYIAIGGDETQDVPPADLALYSGRVAAIVTKYGKKVFGWQETLGALSNPAGAIGEFWLAGINDEALATATAAGAKIVLAPANRAYLDMKYSGDSPEFPVGNTWAGLIPLQTAYDWQPDAQIPGVPADAVAGVEATLFTETVFGIDHLEQLAFPRLPAIAELGWSPAASHDWASFKVRLAAQGPRLRAARINYYLSPELNWPWGS